MTVLNFSLCSLIFVVYFMLRSHAKALGDLVDESLFGIVIDHNSKYYDVITSFCLLNVIQHSL